MKIGRNDPCPCGSGKKYKKCCLSKNSCMLNEKSFLSTFQSSYDYTKDISKELYKRINKYAIDDIVRATFCLNLWRRNRSALAQSLALNRVLTEFGAFGTQRIQSYEQLESFYEEIRDLLKITEKEDYTVDDYGEVFINHLGKSYPIIIGTGHMQVYAVVRYLQELSKISNHEHELTDILEYTKMIIDSTKDANDANTDEIITYELPTELFWNTITTLFDDPLFQIAYLKVFDVMGYTNGPIEMRHFVKHSGDIYPLWNTSILVDYYKILLNISSQENVKLHTYSMIESLLEKTFNYSLDSCNKVLITPCLVDKYTKNNIVAEGFLFATKTKNSLILGLDGNYFKKETEIENLRNKITQINLNSGLLVVEPIQRMQKNGYFGINKEPDCNITYIIIDTFTDLTSSYSLCEEDSTEIFRCTALDFIYFIGFSDGFDELQEFINYYLTTESQIWCQSGKSSLFLYWQNANHMISMGALEYNNIFLDFNETETYTLSYFKNCLAGFPKNNGELFVDPLNWKALPTENGYNKVFRKGCYGFGGDVKQLWKNGYVFFAYNVELFLEDDFEQPMDIALKVIGELNQRMFVRYAEQISAFSVLQNRTLQLLFMPWKYLCKNHKSLFCEDLVRNAVYSDMHVECDTVIIRFTVRLDDLLYLICNSPDRTGENTYLKELLRPLKNYSPSSYKELERKLDEHVHLKKTVGVCAVEQYYYFSDKAISTEMRNTDVAKARKEIAKACLKSGAKPGEYTGKDATQIMRGIQSLAVCSFEKTVAKFNKFDLHYKVLNYLAIQQHGIILNAKRYTSFDDIDEMIADEFEHKTRSTRETNRKNAEVAKYLIETNLTVSHESDSYICSDNDLSYLICFANCLIDLQDDADICYHQQSDLTLVINDMYTVDSKPSDYLLNQFDKMLERKYNTADYYIKNDEQDKVFLEKAMRAFEDDTGVNFDTLIKLLEFMQLPLTERNTAVEIYPNVFEVEKTRLEDEFFDILEGKIDIEKIRDTITFITLDTSKLKIVDGVKHDLLPIWEREKRKDRFDVKPIILKDDKYIYSPVIINSVLYAWESGITEWFLPYELGFTNLNKVLTEWKKRYEDEMVKDIADMFSTEGFEIVIPELELCSRFPKEGYPEELGDYDVFAVSKLKKEVWIIESKVLHKVASIYEVQMQQKSFFVQHKDDEKFQRRIDYLRQNLSKVLSSLRIADRDYKIVAYMVTNKLFESRYKDIRFPIIMMGEFKKIIGGHIQ